MTRGQGTVLVVENNAAMRALIRSLVEPIGRVVQECDTGERAIELYARLHPDWVLMDIEMGGMDGIAATRAIRRSDPHARVVIITEHGEERYRRAAREAGASGFLLKDNLLELPRLLAP
ncbi:MAG: response regulator transcription factor [Gemmatimonadales bacterium]|nr:response regulator transcription factor [Gemmatimonadales bacterium]